MGLTLEQKEQLITQLSDVLSLDRRQKIQSVASQRTHHITVVLEDVFQPHNSAAVIRSCDCFGIQDLHTIEKRNKFTQNPNISMGAEKWIDFHRWQDTGACLNKLKADGYSIVALTLSEKAIPLSEVPVERPLALCIGTEETGLSLEAHAIADTHAFIPMYGFTQSFNLSVCTALCLQMLVHRLKETGVKYQLKKNEAIDLQLRWLMKDIGFSQRILEDFCKKHNLPLSKDLLKS